MVGARGLEPLTSTVSNERACRDPFGPVDIGIDHPSEAGQFRTVKNICGYLRRFLRLHKKEDIDGES
jgi:hypothetical protein